MTLEINKKIYRKSTYYGYYNPLVEINYEVLCAYLLEKIKKRKKLDVSTQ